MNKQYARTDYDGCNYITAGKLYPVKNFNGKTFEISGDGGEWLYCIKSRCLHLDDNDWEIIEESEAMNVLTGKQGMQTAAMDWAEEMRARGWWVDVNTETEDYTVEAMCGHLPFGLSLRASGETEVEARIALMKKWDAEFGEGEKLDREWKRVFVSGLPDGVTMWRFDAGVDGD